MLRYDTMHGQFDGTIEYTDDAIIVNGKTVKFFACMDPKDIPWARWALSMSWSPPACS